MNEMNDKDLEKVAGGVTDDAEIERQAEQYLTNIMRFQCISCKRENKSACQASLKQHFITYLKKGSTPMKKCGSYK